MSESRKPMPKEEQAKREAMGQKVLHIEGPAYLENEQNFFDQQPFAAIIDKVSGQKDISRAALRGVLNSTVYDLHRFSEVLQRREGIRMDSIRYTAQGRGRIRKKHMDEDDSLWNYSINDMQDAMKTVFGALDNFPRWMEYVYTKFDNILYLTDGERSGTGRGKSLVHTPSYLEWLEQKTIREKSMQNVAIQSALIEAFPQQLQGQSLSEAIPNRGQGTVRKRWQIVMASGIKGNR